MINFREILEQPEAGLGARIVTVDGIPVWDYKSSNFDVFLIYEDPWMGVEEEYVTVDELKKYLVDMEIPYDKVKFNTEGTRKSLSIWQMSPELTINFKEDV
tara:strand:- start:597 stop:899 length:303 start_codon:yes stop_codon:yes gene_type:complete